MSEGEWKKCKLENIAKYKTGKLNSNAAEIGGVYPFFTCSPETLKINSYAFDCEAAILAGNNANGVFSLKYYNGKFNAYQRTYIITADPLITNIKFLYYQLDLQLNRLQSISHGTATKYLTMPLLNEIEVNLPSIGTQTRIASVLSALDDKIELNRQTNATLEAIAQAIFKEWFVDFNFPGATGEMVESELGMIPRGWRVDKLGNVVKTILGGTPSTTSSSYWENGTIAWINSGKTNEFRIIEPTAYITAEAVKSSNTKLLPKGTVVLAITGATLGQVSRLEIDSCANQSVVGILENQSVPSEYLYLWVKNNIQNIIRNQSGGAQQHINKNDVNDSFLLVPDTKTIKYFAKTIFPIFGAISLNCFENANLATIRDVLLPKLMSGEIDV